MGHVIAALENETGRKCFDTFRRCLDRERASVVEYDDLQRSFMKEQGETVRHAGSRDLEALARDWLSRAPALRLFMDGSRRTYKIADIPIGTQVFPILAGQVGVGVCKRENRRFSMCGFEIHTVMDFLDKRDTERRSAKQYRGFISDMAPKRCASTS